MNLPTFLVTLLSFLLFFSCEENNNNFLDRDQILQDDDIENADSDKVECEKDENCGENEVCDPYGDCLCNAEEGLFFKYDGKCISFFEANRFFCNGHAGMIDVNPEFKKGHSAFIEKGMETQIICSTCLLGYVGRFCEKKIEGYNDSVMELDEKSNKIDLPFPKPYCKKDYDCVEGLSCFDGYCECPGDVEFKEPDIAYLISMHLGLSEVKNMFLGKDLLKIKDFQLVFYEDRPEDLTNLRCLSNVRSMIIPGYDNLQDFTEITYLKKLQHLAILPGPDISWISEMDNLLSLDLSMVDAGTTDLSFIDNFKSINSIVKLELILYCGSGSCENYDLSPIKKMKNLTNFSLINSKGRIATIDMNIFSEMKHLREVYIQNIEGNVKNVEMLNGLVELNALGIRSTGYVLDSLNKNENLISLVVYDDVVTDNIAKHFPNLLYLTIGNLGKKNNVNILSGLTKLIKFKVDNDIGITYEGLDMVLSEMEHLNLLMLFPLMKNSNLNPLRNIKYIETLQFYSETHDHEIQDRSFIENLLYLHIYDDTSGETGSVFSFVKNCENGGTFCHKKPEKYIGGILNEQGEKTKIINLFSPLFDLNAENDNIEFLKKNNVDITISE